MTDDLIKIPSPEEEELAAKKAELSALSHSLAEKELELEELKLSVRRFQHRYFNQVGYKYVELDELLAQIAEAESRRNPTDRKTKITAEQARNKAQQTAAEFEGFDETGNVIQNRPRVSDDIKKLYRKIASIIHPDKTTAKESRKLRTQLMAELNEAYTKSDVSRMKKIFREWETSPDSVIGEGTASNLVRVIRTIAQVRRRIAEVEKEIASIKESEMYQLMIEVQKADGEGRQLLDEIADAVQQRIDEARQKLAKVI